MFRAAPDDRDNIACMRTIDMRRGACLALQKTPFALHNVQIRLDREAY
jgi:hypothetical protein